MGSLGLLLTLTGCATHTQSTPIAQASPDLRIALTLQPLTPRQMDPTAFTVRLTDARGKPVTRAAVTVELVMTAMDMGRDAVSVRPGPPGGYSGTGRFTMAGDWRVTVTAAHGQAKSVQSFSVSVQ